MYQQKWPPLNNNNINVSMNKIIIYTFIYRNINNTII